MTKVFLFFLFINVLPSYAYEGNCDQVSNPISFVESLSTIDFNAQALVLRSSSNDSYIIAGRGCCSHHGGECGCDIYGRRICCDGTTSPSCRCN